MEGFAGKNFVDPGRGLLYYVSFGGWVDRDFVDHLHIGYLDDNYITLFFGYVGVYRRRTQEVVDLVENNRRVAQRESYDNPSLLVG